MIASRGGLKMIKGAAIQYRETDDSTAPVVEARLDLPCMLVRISAV